MSDEQKQELPVVFAPCKRGKDQMTEGQSCKGRQAFKLSGNGAQLVQFRCTVCSYTWSVPVGGTFHL